MKEKAKNLRKALFRILLFVAFTAAALAVLTGVAARAGNVHAAYTPIYMDECGARVRINGAAGIKFYARMDGETWANCEHAEKRVGFLVGYENELEGELIAGAQGAYDVKGELEEQTANYGLYAGEVTESVFPLVYGKRMTARAYFFDGEIYHYADGAISRSMAYVASAALADGENSKSLMDYVDAAVGSTEISVTGGEEILVAGAEVQLGFSAQTEDVLVPKWLSNDESVATVDENGLLSVKRGSTREVVVTAVLGSRQAEYRFGAHARYRVEYYYENAEGDFIPNAELQTVGYATPDATVRAVTDGKYARGGGYELDETHVGYKDAAAVADDNSTLLKIYYSQPALAGEGQLTDSNNGAWQVSVSYGGFNPVPVSLDRDETVADEGKTASTAIDWQGGSYAYLSFNAKNSIENYGAYNAISFRMKNDAIGDRKLYLYAVNSDGSLSQAAPTGNSGKPWSYYVLPLDGQAKSLADIKVLVKISVGAIKDVVTQRSATGKTYFADFALINYQTPANTLIDFGYSSTALQVSRSWADDVSNNAYVGSGIKDPLTGGTTLKIQDTDFEGGNAPWRYKDSYAFFLGATGNNANGNDLIYNRLSAIFNGKGESEGVKIKFRLYAREENRGFDGYYVKPFDQTKDWTWIPAGSTGKIGGQWTDVEFIMKDLPAQNDCRFYVSILGGWGGSAVPTADGNAAISELYVSNVIWEYV